MNISRAKAGIILTLAIAGLLIFLFSTRAFLNWNDKLTDLLFTATEAPGEILIIEIDDESIRKIGQWPWPRAVFAAALERLAGAAAIGIDVNFKEPSRLGHLDDAAFAAALARSVSPVVIATEILPDGRESPPLLMFADRAEIGFANVDADRDGIVRHFLIRLNEQESFALRIMASSGKEFKEPQGAGRGFYFGPAGTFSRASFRDLHSGALPNDFFNDKIVLIGATAADLQDYRETPFGLMSGVEIQANAVGTILAGKDFSTPNITIVLIILLVALAVFLGLAFESSAMIFGFAAVAIIFYNVAAFIAFDTLVILNIFYPNLALIFGFSASFGWRYATTLKERRFIKDSFSRYVAPEVVEELIRHPEKLSLGGERRELTILFSDIRGFTTLSEGMDPGALTKFLNRYLTVMSDVILAERGVIDKYIGDAIMAIWGAPLPAADHAARAVRAALKMIKALQYFNEENKKRGDPEIKIGIGLNAGEVTVGNLGSDKRFDYTVIGDAVNLASRLEGLTKMYGVSLIVSGNVAKKMKTEDLPGGYAFREIDRVRVKGKIEPIVIFEVVEAEIYQGIKSDFEEGRRLYYAGDFRAAAEKFDAVLKKRADDGPAKLLFDRCGELSTLKGDWDGVYTLTSK